MGYGYAVVVSEEVDMSPVILRGTLVWFSGTSERFSGRKQCAALLMTKYLVLLRAQKTSGIANLKISRIRTKMN